jgi:hypothetical protein
MGALGNAANEKEARERAKLIADLSRTILAATTPAAIAVAPVP